MKQLIKPSISDHEGSVDLFDADTNNERGGLFCVAAAILPEQVEEYWEEYIGKSKEAQEPTPVSNLQEILENWKKVIEGPAQEGAEAGFQHGLKKAYDDIMRAAEWE